LAASPCGEIMEASACPMRVAGRSLLRPSTSLNSEPFDKLRTSPSNYSGLRTGKQKKFERSCI